MLEQEEKFGGDPGERRVDYELLQLYDRLSLYFCMRDVDGGEEAGVILPWGEPSGYLRKVVLPTLAKAFKFDLNAPWAEHSESAKQALLYGAPGRFKFPTEVRPESARGNARGHGEYESEWEGVLRNVERRYRESTSDATRESLEESEGRQWNAHLRPVRTRERVSTRQRVVHISRCNRTVGRRTRPNGRSGPTRRGRPCSAPTELRYRLRSTMLFGDAVPAENLAQSAFFRTISRYHRPAPPPLSRLIASPRTFNLTVSNIPGPREPLWMAGCPLEEAYPVVPLADRHAVSIGFTTVAEQGFFGIYADKRSVPDADALAGADALQALARRSHVRPRAGRAVGRTVGLQHVEGR